MATPRRLLLGAVIAVTVIVSGCVSTPGAKRVALDAVETLDVSAEVKQCMIDVIEGYSEDDIQEFSDAAAEGDADGAEQLTRFEAQLRQCRTGN